MQESRRNEVSADELSETKVVRKANVGVNQKSSERQMWERNKSSQKDKCGSETKVVRKANVGANQKSSVKTNERLTQKGWSLFYIGCRRVVGRLRQSSASLHPPSGTSFLREPLTRPRPATLCRSLPATTQLTSLPVFQQQVPYFEPVCAWTLLYKQHTS